jgi:hypothetical protein
VGQSSEVARGTHAGALQQPDLEDCMPIRSKLGRSVRLTAAGVVAALAVMATPAVSLAAPTPSVSTGSATLVQASTATLNGSINPQGQSTTYFFEYGHTRSYGYQTVVAGAGAGNQTVHVSVPVSGLASLTTYHYRLIAVNGSGASTGGDQTFTTLAVPLSLSIAATPNPVAFGGVAYIQGTLSGTGNAYHAVELQGNAFPFVAGFTNIGNPQITSAAGAFAFPVIGLTEITQYRVITVGSPLVASAVAVEGVAVRVSVHVARALRPHYVHIYGAVTPSEVGMQIGIVRVVNGRNVLVAGTVLKPANATASRYSKVFRVAHPGIYRVLARITDGSHYSAYSAPVRIG